MILSRILLPPFIKRVRGPFYKVRTEFHSYDLRPKWDAPESWTKGEKREFVVYRTDRDNEARKILLHLGLHKEKENFNSSGTAVDYWRAKPSSTFVRQTKNLHFPVRLNKFPRELTCTTYLHLHNFLRELTNSVLLIFFHFYHEVY